MIRSVALGILASSWLLGPPASAAEGKVAQPRVTIDSNRAASYNGAPASAVTSGLSPQVGDPKAARQHVRSGKSALSRKVTRGPVIAQSAGLSDFHIYDAVSTLRQDRDGDGHHSEFEIRFDADVLAGDARVYAKLYLRRAGESDWFLYHETEDFTISGQVPDDEYYVITALDDGYPADRYDVLIDLYESGVSGIVATLGPQDSGALSDLPLEEAGLDVPFGIAGFYLDEVSTQLLGDADGDGHYSRFRITFDPDTDLGSRLVYARIWVRPRGGEWFEEHATEDFPVRIADPSDAYVLDVEWRSGYPTAFYDFQIDLYDTATGQLAASAGSERLALAQVPLEDQSRDQYVSPPAPGSGGSTSSREGGGGALGLGSALGLLTLLGLRSRRPSAHR